MSNVIEIRNLSKEFSTGIFKKKRVTALAQVSLEIKRGEVFALLGPNGAGKTSLAKILCGMLPPTKGQASVLGYKLDQEASKVKQGVSYLFSNERSFYWQLTGRQNLEFFGALYKTKNLRKVINVFIRRVGLTEVIERKVKQYSSGMKHRLSIAASLLNNPEIIFIDEPTKGLDPEAQEHFYGILRRMIQEDKTVFLITHSFAEALLLSDRIGILHQGRLKRIIAVTKNLKVADLEREYFKQCIN